MGVFFTIEAGYQRFTIVKYTYGVSTLRAFLRMEQESSLVGGTTVFTFVHLKWVSMKIIELFAADVITAARYCSHR